MKPRSNRNYSLLLASQFLGAFGDNAILAVIVGQLTLLQKSGLLTPDELRTRSALYTSLLFIPYVLLAPLAGYLNDRYAKTHWLFGGNALKLVGTGVCLLSVWYGYFWQAPGYLIVGMGSTVYSPAKYGILPEILERDQLVKANGMVELLTLLAILTGAIAGSIMVDRLPVIVCYGVLLAIFGASMALNGLMSPTPSDPSVRLHRSVTEFRDHFAVLFLERRPHREGGVLGGLRYAGSAVAAMVRGTRLGRILVGTGLFWVCGAAMKINFQPWGLDVLALPDNTQIALLGLWLSVGVMLGSVVSGALYRVGDLSHTRRFGYLLAALLVVISLIGPLGLSSMGRHVVEATGTDGHSHAVLVVLPAVMVVLVAAGFASGLFLIPLNAALQAESDPQKLGKTIAVQNFCDNTGMILAGLVVLICARVGLTASQVFLVLAFIVVGVLFWLKIPPVAPNAVEEGDRGAKKPHSARIVPPA